MANASPKTFPTLSESSRGGGEKGGVARPIFVPWEGRVEGNPKLIPPEAGGKREKKLPP